MEVFAVRFVTTTRSTRLSINTEPPWIPFQMEAPIKNVWITIMQESTSEARSTELCLHPICLLCTISIMNDSSPLLSPRDLCSHVAKTSHISQQAWQRYLSLVSPIHRGCEWRMTSIRLQMDQTHHYLEVSSPRVGRNHRRIAIR